MGKNKWIKHGHGHVDHEDDDFHPGCMWGIIHALGYHNWHSHVNKKHIRIGNRNSRAKLVIQDPSELHNLLDDNESQFLVDKDTRHNKLSLKARMQALIDDEMHKENSSKQRRSVSSNQHKFQRTYSIHHLQDTEYTTTTTKPQSRTSWDGLYERKEHDLSKTCSDFVPGNVESGANKGADVLEMFEANNMLFFENSRDTEAGFLRFSPNQMVSKRKARLTKSGSYPVSHLSQRRNFKPSTLENKKNEVWSSAKEERFKYNCDCESDGFDIRKTTVMHKRSSSLNESLDRYAKLLEHSFRKEVKLYPSKSLKLSEREEKSIGNRSISAERIAHLSKATEESECNSEKVEQTEDIKTVESITSLKPSTDEEINAEVLEDLIENIDEVMMSKGNPFTEQDVKCTESTLNDVVRNSEIRIEKDSSSSAEFQSSEGLVLEHNVDDVGREVQLDLCYVRDILEHSGLSSNFSQGTCHSPDQMLNPSLVQELESYWHKQQECCGEDFYFCCQHQLLFDLVNEVLVHTYDRCCTYYPKALSYSCRLRPFTVGDRMMEEVFDTVGSLLRLRPEQEQFMDDILDQDLVKDDGWMNLQLEAECLALELEDMIFNDFLEELITSL